MHKCTLAYDLMLVKYIISAHGPIYFPSQFRSKKEKTSYFSMKMRKLLQKLRDVALLDFCFPTNQQ